MMRRGRSDTIAAYADSLTVTRFPRVKSKQPFSATIQTLEGRQIPISFGKDTTAHSLHEKLLQETNLPTLSRKNANYYLLIHTSSGKVMDGSLFTSSGGQTVLTLGIEDGSIVYAILTNKPLRLTAPCSTVKKYDIPKTELRSLNTRQLKELALQVILRCEAEGWTSTDLKKKGTPLKPEDVTLYDLVEHYVKPITAERQCSYVEMVSSKEKSPTYYVSHYWGDSVLGKIACLLQHAKDHMDDGSFTYWICAYANNQHKLQQEINSHGDPIETSFFRAIQLSQGTVSIMDQHRICFARIWCAFEIFLALRDMNSNKSNNNNNKSWGSKQQEEDVPYMYEIYTVKATPDNRHDNACLGLRDVNVFGGAQYGAKGKPPFPCCPEMLDICIEKAAATRDNDRRSILNYICGGRAAAVSNEEPPSGHCAYQEINNLLRARIALSTYQAALAQQQPMEKYRNAIRHHPNLKRLSMNFYEFDPFVEEARHFMATALPEGLESLQLYYGGLAFESSDEFARGLSRQTNLKEFTL
ncbi:expressed unknown protein (Partial), partial [Seminavis robusta]|eukprot:Sro2418_g327020.1 n/a (526) ;mRNA; f:13339-14917